MPDMLVKLYELPESLPLFEQLKSAGITIRKAMSYEKKDVVEWVQQVFGHEWASECDIAFSNQPISCFIATENGNILGFACYDCTARDYFGPTGVLENQRGRGVGKALLFACLYAMKAIGYAYAIIGGVGPVEFYQKSVNAVLIEGSKPGVYSDRLKKKN